MEPDSIQFNSIPGFASKIGTKLERKTSVAVALSDYWSILSKIYILFPAREEMGSMFSGNRLSKEEMEVVTSKAKEIVSSYPVVVFRF